MADNEHRVPAALDGVQHVGGRRSGAEPLVGRGPDTRCLRELLGGLAGAEQRTGEDGVGLDPFGGEQIPERACVAPAFGSEGSELVGLAGSRVRVADEVEAHVRRIRASARPDPPDLPALEDRDPDVAGGSGNDVGVGPGGDRLLHMLYSLRRDRLTALSAELLGYVDNGRTPEDRGG
jgi:hypothetical protein